MPVLSITPSDVLSLVSLLIFIVWIIYTIVLIYHWVRYNYASKSTLLALATYVLVSIGIYFFGVSGFI